MPAQNIEYYNAALDAIQAGRPMEALEAVENALVEDARDAETWRLYILILTSLGRTAEADSALRKLEDLGLAEADGVALRAATAMGAGDPTTAIALYRECVALDPARAEHHTGLAIALLETGDHAEAAEVIERAIGLAPDDARAHYIQGRILRLGGRNSKALTALTQAVNLDPDLMMAVYEQGMLFAENDQPDAALANFERFLQAHPGDTSATQAVAMLRNRMTQTR